MNKVTKTSVTLSVMAANEGKPMAEVVSLIVVAQHAAGFTDVTAERADGAYRWAVKNAKAPGVIPERRKAEPKVKVEKPAKQPKPVAEAKPKAEKPAKSPEEIERIKAANLARLKQVHAKVKQNVKRDEVEVLEADPFLAPVVLTRDEVTALV